MRRETSEKYGETVQEPIKVVLAVIREEFERVVGNGETLPETKASAHRDIEAYFVRPHGFEALHVLDA